jgi:hypothetical protein
MVELSYFTEFILPPADEMATTVTDSLNYRLDTAIGKTGLHALHSTLVSGEVDVANFPTEATLTADGPDETGDIAMGSEATTFIDARKVVLSRVAPFPASTPLPSKRSLST